MDWTTWISAAIELFFLFAVIRFIYRQKLLNEKLINLVVELTRNQEVRSTEKKKIEPIRMTSSGGNELADVAIKYESWPVTVTDRMGRTKVTHYIMN